MNEGDRAERPHLELVSQVWGQTGQPSGVPVSVEGQAV